MALDGIHPKQAGVTCRVTEEIMLLLKLSRLCLSRRRPWYISRKTCLWMSGASRSRRLKKGLSFLPQKCLGDVEVTASIIYWSNVKKSPDSNLKKTHPNPRLVFEVSEILGRWPHLATFSEGLCGFLDTCAWLVIRPPPLRRCPSFSSRSRPF